MPTGKVLVFEDHFHHLTTHWRRGVVAFSARPGPLTVTSEDGDLRNHLTLAGTAVHPDTFREYDLSFTWSFEDPGKGRLLLAFGKPHEWSRTDEAPLCLHVLPSGEWTAINRQGELIGSGRLRTDNEGRWTLVIRKTPGEFSILNSQTPATVPWPASETTGGYFTVRVFDNHVRLLHFSLTSPHHLLPLTEEARRADIDTWIRKRMDENHADFDRLAAAAQQARRDGAWGFNTDLEVSPGLVRRNETVTAIFKFTGPAVPEGKAWLQENYLAEPPGPVREVGLDWAKTGPDRFEARIDIRADQAGNYRMIWIVGRDILSRAFAAIDSGYAVCTLWVGSNRPDLDAEIHRFGLPGDYWIDFDSPFGEPAPRVLDRLRNHARRRHQYGDRLVAFINGAWIVPGIPNTNLFALDGNLQEEGIRLTRRLWETLDFGPLDLIGSYTLGHATVPAARRAGIKAINSLCQWQNFLDGGNDNDWRINHWAAPIGPYFGADDDFRKVAPGKSVVMFGMGTASSVRSYSIFSMEGCPTLCYPNCRYSQEAETANLHRFYQAVENFLADAAQNYEPVFFTVGLENFLRKPDWARANELGVEYLVRRARTEKLVFASAADIADFFLRTYDRQPPHVYFQPDTYCGYREAKKPDRLPDRIEYSDAQIHSLHHENDPLPVLLWDFTHPWSSPEWADMADLRQETKLVTPEQVPGGNCVPAAVDLTGASVRFETFPRPDGLDLILHFDLPRPMAVPNARPYRHGCPGPGRDCPVFSRNGIMI